SSMLMRPRLFLSCYGDHPDLHSFLHDALPIYLSAQVGETDDMTADDHVRSLTDTAPDFRIDVVLADPTAVEDLDDLADAAAACAARVLLRQIRVGDGTPRHDPLRLAAAYRDAFEGVLGDVGPMESEEQGGLVRRWPACR